MKRLSLALSTALAMSASSAFAVSSEILRLTPTGVMEMTPTLIFSVQKSAYDSAYSTRNTGYEDLTRSNLTEKLMFEFGLNDLHSAGGEISLSEFKSEISPVGASSVQRGMNDLRLFTKNMTPMGDGVFHYGADLLLAVAPLQVNNNGDSNTSSGGHSVAPYAGFEADSALGGVIGTRISHTIAINNRVYTNTDDSTRNSTFVGNEETKLTVFNEWDYNTSVKFGSALSIINYSNSIWTYENGSMATAGGSTQADLKLYVPMQFEFATLLPAFTFSRFTAMDNAIYSSQSAWELSFAGRFSF